MVATFEAADFGLTLYAQRQRRQIEVQRGERRAATVHDVLRAIRFGEVGGTAPDRPADVEFGDGARIVRLLTAHVVAVEQTFEALVVRIALAALNLIQPGDTIALSPGTTTTHLARNIRRAQITNLTVVTNAVNIAMELANVPGLTLNLTGGFLLPDFFALVGPMAEQSLGQMYVSKAFVGVTGLSAEYGLTGPNQLEALTHRMTIQRAQQTIVLSDHTKLGQVALHTIAPITAISCLITDSEASEASLAELRDKDVDITLA